MTELPSNHPERDAIHLLTAARNEQPHNGAGDVVATFLGDAVLYLWRSRETRKGCGKPTHVTGTNGGTMPCGAMLTIFGKTAPYFCAACDQEEASRV